MAEVQGSYDRYEKTWEDEDGCRVRVTTFEEGHIVIRTAYPDKLFGAYVDLGPEDVKALYRHLQPLVEEV